MMYCYDKISLVVAAITTVYAQQATACRLMFSGELRAGPFFDEAALKGVRVIRVDVNRWEALERPHAKSTKVANFELIMSRFPILFAQKIEIPEKCDGTFQLQIFVSNGRGAYIPDYIMEASAIFKNNDRVLLEARYPNF